MILRFLGVAMLAIAGLLLPIADSAQADCRRVVRAQAVAVHNPVVVQAVAVNHVQALAVTPVIATYLQVPVFTAVYTGHQHQARQDDQEVLALKRRVAELESKAATAPSPLAAPQPQKAAGNAFASRCLTCHDKSNATGKGGNVVFTESGKMLMTDRMVAAALAEVVTGGMPKGSKLSDAELEDIVSTLRGFISSPAPVAKDIELK